MGRMTLCALLAVSPVESQAQFDRSQWTFQAESATVVSHEGREALRLVNGIAWLPTSLANGSVEFDMFVTGEMGFSGVLFRMQDPGNYEHVYLRSHLSGLPDATQYEPVFNGTGAWQIYTGPAFSAPVPFAVRKWLRVRVDFARGAAALYVDSEKPVQVIPRLKGSPAAGRVGITSSIAPAYFANFRVVAGAPSFEVPDIPELPTPPGSIRSWGVSAVRPESTVVTALRLEKKHLEELDWTTGISGERGITNLARYRSRGAGSNTAFAAVRIHTSAATTQRLRFGFSDRVRVFLNGRLLYTGEDVFRSRDYRFLGTIGLFDEVVLPLTAGENLLVFAVSESFGGWGIVGTLPNAAPSVSVSPYCGARACRP